MASTVRTKAHPTIHEFELIRAIHRRHGRHTPSVIQGIGDDAAIITSRAGQWTVLTTDLLTEAHRHQPPCSPAVPRDDGRLPPAPRRTHRRGYVGFERRMVSQCGTDRDGPFPPGPVSERCTNRGSSLCDRHNRRRIGRPKTLERSTAPYETLPVDHRTLDQAPAISHRTAPASNRARRGRPMAQYPSIRDLRD